jgi:N-acetylated-alpha-linked acidic dipeptidase
VYPGEGDPLTPGYAAVEGAERITVDQSRDPAFAGNLGFRLGTIPSIPISADAALPIMAGLGGVAAPAAFTGSLVNADGTAVAYSIGGAAVAEPLVVEMVNEMDFRPLTPIWNVIGVIPGAIERDRAVVLGNHRDAWVGGASDPSSGTASMLEMARSLGAMYRDGWRPRRTMVIASVDAEEYGLVGSVEWGEELAATFGARVVAYLNCDMSVSGPGPLSVRASPSLIESVFATAKLIPQPPWKERPATGANLFEVWLESFRTKSGNAAAEEPVVEGLGSGSDFAVFLSHIGITSCDMSIYSDPDIYGQYHSVFDSFPWMDKFGDPNWQFHPAIAAFWGALAVRIAEAPIVPLEYSRLARYASGYVDAVERAARTAGMTGLHFPRLRGAVADLGTAATQAAAARDKALTSRSALEHRIVSDRLMFAERALVSREGMPGRAWFKHVIYSPAKHNSYGSQKFPGLTDAIAEGDEATAKMQLDVVVRHITAMTRQLTSETI